MKTIVLLCLLLSLVYSQDTCSSITDERTCTSSNGKCMWSVGVACDGTTHGHCREMRPCLTVITCAAEATFSPTTHKAFTFSDSCIPSGWMRVNSSLCTCQRPTCDPPCGKCETCSPSGVCVSTSPRGCSNSDENRKCRLGYECQESDCRSICVPTCNDPVQCFIDPCLTPRPNGCSEDAICVANYCGGCNRNFYDPVTGEEVCNECQPEDCGRQPPESQFNCSSGGVGGYTGRCIKTERGTCAWEYKECRCPPVTCALYCEYGFKTGRDGCPICECNDAPPCNTLLPCEPVECPDGQRPVIKPGKCCPSCVDRCSAVMCPAVVCDSGYVGRIPPGECCPVCYPVNECTTVMCPAIAECGPGYTKVKRGCCDICEPQVPCTAVLCPQIRCASGYKPVVPSGECCPECKPIPDCGKDYACPEVACLPATHKVERDLTCCPVCEPDNRCDNVRCAQPNCRREAWITRRGECCPQCPQCHDRPDGRILCNDNDDEVCRAGYTRGENCSMDVPRSSRREVEFSVKLCKRPACEQLTPQEMRLLLAQASVDESRIFVRSDGQDDADTCCYRYTVVLSAEVNDGYDVEKGRTAVEDFVQQNPDLSMDEEQQLASGAALTALSAILLCFSALLFLA